MRITKKFAGASCIGKQVFQPSDPMDEGELAAAQEELLRLEHAFVSRLRGRSGMQRSRASERDRGTSSSLACDNADEEEDEEDEDELLPVPRAAPRWQAGGRGRPPLSSSSSQGLGRRILSAPNLQAYGYESSRQRPLSALQNPPEVTLT